MKLLSMTASFGCLSGQTLSLTEGLNLLTLPNEAGKSTWCAFLLTMLYGLDSAERSTKMSLAAKTKYKPWSGAPMAGRIDLLWQEKKITIERGSSGRGQFNTFRAYETDSGAEVPALTAADCGLVLLGVERAVFERSAFIRQAGLAVSQDAALEQRLSALVTTGQEENALLPAKKKLQELRNALRYHNSGRLPQLEQELERTGRMLGTLAEEGRQLYTLSAEQSAAEDTCAQLSARRDTLITDAKQSHFARAQAAEADAAQKAEVYAAAQKAAQALPSESVLHALSKALDRWNADSHALQARWEAAVHPESPDCDPDAAEADAASLRDPPSTARCLLSGLALLLLAALLFCLRQPLPSALFAAAGAVCLVWMLFRRRHIADQNAEIFQKYGVDSRQSLLQKAGLARSAVMLTAQWDEQAAQLEQQKAVLEQQRQRLFSQVLAFRPDFDQTVEAAKAAVSDALEHLRALDAARRDADAAQTLAASLADSAPAAAPELMQTESSLTQAKRRLAELREQAAALRGRVESQGDPTALTARQEELAAQIAALTDRFDALGLALDALEAAGAALQSRYSPVLSSRAGEILAGLTGGRYDRVQLDRTLAVSAGLPGEVLTHQLLSLSQGTADQLYLALRLALCELALPGDEPAPLILDDALVNFDDTRAAAALHFLQALAQERQILLFTCHSREAALLRT